MKKFEYLWFIVLYSVVLNRSTVKVTNIFKTRCFLLQKGFKLTFFWKFTCFFRAEATKQIFYCIVQINHFIKYINYLYQGNKFKNNYA